MWQYLTQIIEAKSIPENMYGNSVRFTLKKWIRPIPCTQCVAAYWKSSNTECWTTKLSQILANNIDTWGEEVGLRIYVRYCRRKGKNVRNEKLMKNFMKKTPVILGHKIFFYSIWFHINWSMENYIFVRNTNTLLNYGKRLPLTQSLNASLL